MVGKGEIQVIAGKGGVGKTTVSAIFAKLLSREKEKLLVIDADPMVNLGYALGEMPERTIGDYREEIIASQEARMDLISRPIKELIHEIIKTSDRGYDLLAMGRAEGKGCFCSVNEMLRYGIQAASKAYDMTLIDCEAGVEQVNRRAVHRIDKLVLVTDTSRRGFATLAQVRDIATTYNEGAPLLEFVLVNRVRSGREQETTRTYAKELGFTNIEFVPEDDNILAHNLKGSPLIDLPDNSPGVLAIGDALKKMERLCSSRSIVIQK